MKRAPFEEGSDDEFVARMRRRRLLTEAEIAQFEALAAVAAIWAGRNRLQMRPVQAAA